MTIYKGREIEILSDDAGYYARIDGQDEPLADDLDRDATAADALALAKELVDSSWA